VIAFNALSLEIKAAILAAIAAALFAAGWSVNGWRLDGKLADLQRAHAEQEAAAAEVSAGKLAVAMARGDVLSAKAAAAETALNTLTQEKDDAIHRLTVGRPCLGSAAVRVLNGPALGLKPAAMPQAPGSPVPADGAFATDSDVGLWIASAQRSYNTCRGRLQAVADFYEIDPHDDR
jgi:hypothetical protein